MKSLSEIKRRPVAEALAGLLANTPSESKLAAERLVSEAKDFGISIQNFMKVAINPKLGEAKDIQRFDGLNGFEAALSFLNLPLKDDLDQGIFLQAAADTFQKYPGTRVMFPEVVDQMLKWKNRQSQLETLAPMISQSRTIGAAEMITTAVEDDTDARGTFTIAEFGKIPVRTIRTSQTAVGIFKHGSGVKTSYEFERRASLDILTPFAARVARELEISKVRAATAILVNGDGVNGPAPVTNITAVDGVVVGTQKLRAQYAAFATWLMQQSAKGTPIDTVVGNIKSYIELLLMFTPTLNGQTSEIEAAVKAGGPNINLSLPLLGGMANFVLSTSMPDNKLLGYTKAETLEELVEEGSTIAENERSIQNQSVVYVRTENSGFKLAFGDTRSILDLNA